MTDPKDLNPNDFSDSDWYEFTGGLQRPFTSKDQQDRWVTLNGEELPANAHELEAWWKQSSQPSSPERVAEVKAKLDEIRKARG